MLFGSNSRRNFVKALAAFLGIGTSGSEGIDGHGGRIPESQNGARRRSVASPEAVDQAVASVDELRDAKPRLDCLVFVKGYHSAGEEGGGLFWWDASGEAGDADGGLSFASTVSGYAAGDVEEGLWRRVWDQRQINVKWFGAKGDGQTNDHDALQDAFNVGARDEFVEIYVPQGTYNTDEFIELPGTNTALRGAGGTRSVIHKTTESTTGKSEVGGIERDVDAVIQVDTDGSRDRKKTIRDIQVSGPEAGEVAGHNMASRNGFGIHVVNVQNLELTRCIGKDRNTVIRVADGFLWKVRNCEVSDATHGFHFGNGDGFTTSLHIENCYANRVEGRGYRLDQMTYCTLTSCACDHHGSYAYRFDKVQNVTMNACGSEVGSGELIRITTGNLNVTGFDTFREGNGTISDSSSAIRVEENARVVFTGARMENFANGTNMTEVYVGTGCRVTAIDTRFPQNGTEGTVIDGRLIQIKDGHIIQNGTQVLGDQVTDADLGNSINTGDAATDDAIHALINVVTTHGLGNT